MTNTVVAFMRRSSNWNPDKPVREQSSWDEHALFMDSLFEAGSVVMAGPFADGSGSMIVLAVESVDEAQAILKNDPWAHEDILVPGEFKEWTIFLDARDSRRNGVSSSTLRLSSN